MARSCGGLSPTEGELRINEGPTYFQNSVRFALLQPASLRIPNINAPSFFTVPLMKGILLNVPVFNASRDSSGRKGLDEYLSITGRHSKGAGPLILLKLALRGSRSLFSWSMSTA